MTGDIDWRIQAADRNFAASYEKLVGTRPGSELRRYGATVAFDSRIPIRIFNGVAVLEPATTRDLRTALAWIRDRDIPFSVWVREDLLTSVGKTLLEAGVAPIEDGGEPVMGMLPPAEVPDPPAGVSIREVVDEGTMEDHIRSTVGSGFPEEATRQLYDQRFLDDPDIRMFTAYVDGRPAGNSVAIRSGPVSGVYSVGVPEELRRRGIGAAITWAAVRAGHEWGCGFVVLQSSPMGFGVYRQMGFEVLTHYAIFR